MNELIEAITYRIKFDIISDMIMMSIMLLSVLILTIAISYKIIKNKKESNEKI